MLARRELEALRKTAFPPLENRSQWMASAEDSVEFLKTNAAAEYLVIYASMGTAFIHSVLAPVAALTPANANELMTAHLHADSSYCIQHAYCGDKYEIYLEGPLRGAGCASISEGEQLIYRRHFNGLKDHNPIIEINQRLVHALDLHFIPERNAYCRLDDRGDFEEVIVVSEKLSDDPQLSERAVLIMAKPLAEYMAVSGQALFRKFDFTRVPYGNFHGWHDHSRDAHKAADLFYSLGVMPGHASYVNGGQVIRTTLTVEMMVAAWREAENRDNRRYETFKIFDRKNNDQVDCSCSPESIVSYFENSDKPWTISPAFFRPDVLARYKADPDKYDLSDRSISCRNAWSLKTYDINEAGQVHTYIGYLADLPFEEQQYWKLFNEWPKANISKRAFENDILGEWSTDRDPLQGIKQTIHELDRRKPSWWKSRGEELAERVLAPASGSSKEWADEIMALDQLIVEGFLAKELRAMCKKLSVSIDVDWQGLKLLEAMLAGLGVTVPEAKRIVSPLRTLHHLRSKVKGHASPDERRLLEREAIANHGSFRSHFLHLCEGCDDALIQIVSSLAAFDAPPGAAPSPSA